jgi:hypothetical protein
MSFFRKLGGLAKKAAPIAAAGALMIPGAPAAIAAAVGAVGSSAGKAAANRAEADRILPAAIGAANNAYGDAYREQRAHLDSTRPAALQAGANTWLARVIGNRELIKVALLGGGLYFAATALGGGRRRRF